MTKVTVAARLIQGEKHVRSDTEGPAILFVPRFLLDGHIVRTEHPDTPAWKAADFDESLKPDDPWPQPKITFGEGFVVLIIEHADDKTWAYLSSLDDDEIGEGSTREHFEVLVKEFEYSVEEPDTSETPVTHFS